MSFAVVYVAYQLALVSACVGLVTYGYLRSRA